MAEDGGASDVSISLRLVARESVLKTEARITSWLVYLFVVFQVLTSYSIIIIPFLVNEYVYMAVLALLLGSRFAHEEKLFKYGRRPALLLLGPAKSFFFNAEHGLTTSMSARQWALYIRFAALILAMVSASAIYWTANGVSPICGVSGLDWCIEAANDKARRNALHECWLDSACYTPPARLVALEDATKDRGVISFEALACEFEAIECFCVHRGQSHGEFNVYGWLHRTICGFLIPCEKTSAELMWHSGCKLAVPLVCILAAPLLLLASRAWLNGRKLNKAWLSSQAEAEEAELRQGRARDLTESAWARAKLAADITLVLLDMLLDILSIFTLVRTKQYLLAILQGAVVVAGVAEQLRVGVGVLVIAVTESFQKGYRTNVLTTALQTEKLQESFWSVLIQSLALPSLFNLDVLTALQLSGSILSSMLGISGALYALVHLGCDGNLTDAESIGQRSRVYGRQRDTE